MYPHGEHKRGRNRRAHHEGDVLYRGPFIVPDHIAEIVRESPELYRTTHRHLTARYVGIDSTVWLFRCRIPTSRAMVGEIVLTPEGRYRVHAWSTASPSDTYRTVEELIAREVRS